MVTTYTIRMAYGIAALLAGATLAFAVVRNLI